MNTYELAKITRSMLAFQEEIAIHPFHEPQSVLRTVLEQSPALLYYIESVSYSYTALRFCYRNRNFPPDRVHTPAASEIERLLRQTVMRYEPKVVFAVSSGINVSWIVECFMKKTVSFYPNTKAYHISCSQFPHVPFKVYEIGFDYRIGRVMLKTMEQDVAKKVGELQKQLFPFGMPDSVKSFIAHNYLATTVTYWQDKDRNPIESSYAQSAYGALLKGKCVCQGYAEAYKRLMDGAGISCDLVSGQVVADGEWHAWNIVHLDRGRVHCHVDVTWDSGGRKSSINYFLKGDDFFERERTWDRYYYPPCVNGNHLAAEARAFCAENRARLLNCGLKPEWIQ